MTDNKALGTFLRVVRGLALYASFVLIHLIAAFFFRTSQIEGLMNEALAAGIVRTLLIPLVFFSVARVFAEEDLTVNAALGDNTDLSLLARCTRLLAHPDVRLELLLLLGAVALLPTRIGFFSVAALFATPPLLTELLVTLIALLTVALLYLLARLSAWQKHVDERGARGEITRDGAGTADISSMLMYTSGTHFTGGVQAFGGDTAQVGGYEHRDRQTRASTALFWRVPVLLAIYGFGGFALTFFAPALISFWFILEALGNVRPLLPIALIALTILCISLYHVLRALRIRARFLGNLKRVCREYGFTYAKPKRPYASLFRLKDEVSFTLHANGKAYDCKLFASVRRHCPLFFHEDGVLHCTHSLRFRRVEYLCWSTRHDFSFESENEKICIVSPVPATVYAGDERWHRPIDTGMAVGGYRIFSSSGFIGALTRDCIERDK